MNRLGHQNYKNENTETKYLNNTRKSRTLKVKNSLLELKKDFKELRDRELRDREIKIRKDFLNQLFCL